MAMPRFCSGARKSTDVNCEPLVGVPDFRLTEPQRGVECGQAEGGLHGIGKLPTQHVTAEPVHHRDQVQEATLHRNIGNIGAPDLIGPLDGDAAQQVRVDLVVRVRPAQIGFGIVRLDPKNAHQPLDAFAVHRQFDRHPAAAEVGALDVQLVELPEQSQILGALWSYVVIVG